MVGRGLLLLDVGRLLPDICLLPNGEDFTLEDVCLSSPNEPLYLLLPSSILLAPSLPLTKDIVGIYLSQESARLIKHHIAILITALGTRDKTELFCTCYGYIE